MSGITTRNVNYEIRESRYLPGGNYHDVVNKLYCSMEQATRYRENAEKMSKDERIAASNWSTRCSFDRILKRDIFARKINTKSERDVLNFLRHEHVVRLFVSCSRKLRYWDDHWVEHEENEKRRFEILNSVTFFIFVRS